MTNNTHTPEWPESPSFCANCSAELNQVDTENDNSENQNKYLSKRYFALDVKSRIMSSKPLYPRDINANSASPIEEISIRQALSVIFNLKIESEKSELPICFVCHLILNDLYRAYVEFSQLRKNNSFLGKELLKSTSNSRNYQETSPTSTLSRFKTVIKPVSATVTSTVPVPAPPNFLDGTELLHESSFDTDSRSNQLETSDFGIRSGADVEASGIETDQPFQVKFEVFDDDNEPVVDQDEDYQHSESMDVGLSTNYKSEAQFDDDGQETSGDAFEMGTESSDLFLPTNLNPLYSRSQHSRVQQDPGSSSSSFSIVSPYVDESLADEDDMDPLSVSNSSSMSLRARKRMNFQMPGMSTDSERILPTQGPPGQGRPMTRTASHAVKGAPADLRMESQVEEKNEGKKKKPPYIADDAQPIGEPLEYTISGRGQKMAIWQGHTFHFERQTQDTPPRKIWRCSKRLKNAKCLKRIHSRDSRVIKELHEHNHSASTEEIHRRDFISSFKKTAAEAATQPPSVLVAEKLSGVPENVRSALPTVAAMKRTVQYVRAKERGSLPLSHSVDMSE